MAITDFNHNPIITFIAQRNKLSHNVTTVLCNIGRMIGKQYSLHLIVGNDAVPENISEFYKVHTCHVPAHDPGSIRYALRAAFWAARNIKPDVIMNIIDPQSLGFAATIAGRYYSIPAVCRQTGDTFDEYRQYRFLQQKIRKFILFNFFGGAAFRSAQHIIVLGEYFKTDMIRRGYDEDKITILPQPFDATPFSPALNDEKTVLRQRLGLQEEKKIILFTGRISYLKGADRLHAIIREVSKTNRQIQFCLVGNGDWLDRFQDFSPETVHATGTVPHEQIADYYKAADLLLFPSRAEGLPNTVLEAIACRLPIVAAPVGEIPNYVSNTFTKTEDFAEFILTEDWKPEPIPDWFDWETQKKNYSAFFHKVITEWQNRKK